MLAFKANRLTLYLIELCLLLVGIIINADGIRGERKRGRESYVPCPHPKCQCKPDKRGDVVVRCNKVTGTLPEFLNLNISFGELILAHRNLLELPEHGFRGIRTKVLDVGSNPLRKDRIHDLAFKGLEDVLEVLWLNGCGLNEFPDVSLSILKKLTVLHMEDNKIEDIPGHFLSGNKQLRELNLNRNNIKSISLDAFAELTNLKQLKLGENQIRSLPAKLFKVLSNLTSLDLSQNFIQTVVPGTFEGLKSLRWLELESNLIGSLNRDTFRGARNLKNMKIENNQLIAIADNAFRAIGKLGYLSIDISNVSTLTATSFGGLSKLETLSIGEIPPSDLPDGFFSSMRNLRRLSLYDNMGNFRGLRKSMFAEKFPFKNLGVFLSPIRSCRCNEPWIKNMTILGAYVHGHCSDSRPLSCTSKAMSSVASNKDANDRRKKIKSP